MLVDMTVMSSMAKIFFIILISHAGLHGRLEHTSIQPDEDQLLCGHSACSDA